MRAILFDSNFSLLGHAEVVVLTVILEGLFLLFAYNSRGGVIDRSEPFLHAAQNTTLTPDTVPPRRYPTEKWAYTFSVEKMVPITMAALVCNFVTEMSRRGVFLQVQAIKEQQVQIKAEQVRTEELLTQSLPPTILNELKQGKDVLGISAFGSVLYADIVSFTTFSGTVTAPELVSILNQMFVLFDALARKHGVEKIKTLGDCYVACTGVLTPTPDHASSMCMMGCGMQQAMGQLNEKFAVAAAFGQGKGLRIRVGAHSGEVVGGVIGNTKFAFDVFGKHVEIANAMESEGVAGRVSVSQTTRDLAVTEMSAHPSLLGFAPMDEPYTHASTGDVVQMFLVSEEATANPDFGLADVLVEDMDCERGRHKRALTVTTGPEPLMAIDEAANAVMKLAEASAGNPMFRSNGCKATL